MARVAATCDLGVRRTEHKRKYCVNDQHFDSPGHEEGLIAAIRCRVIGFAITHTRRKASPMRIALVGITDSAVTHETNPTEFKDKRRWEVGADLIRNGGGRDSGRM